MTGRIIVVRFALAVRNRLITLFFQWIFSFILSVMHVRTQMVYYCIRRVTRFLYYLVKVRTKPEN